MIFCVLLYFQLWPLHGTSQLNSVINTYVWNVNKHEKTFTPNDRLQISIPWGYKVETRKKNYAKYITQYVINATTLRPQVSLMIMKAHESHIATMFEKSVAFRRSGSVLSLFLYFPIAFKLNQSSLRSKWIPSFVSVIMR